MGDVVKHGRSIDRACARADDEIARHAGRVRAIRDCLRNVGRLEDTQGLTHGACREVSRNLAIGIR